MADLLPNKTDFVFDTIIIGAGISGLYLSRKLAEADRPNLIIEKSKSVGGRVATRRLGDSVFDHGAQFFKFEDVGNSADEIALLEAELEREQILGDWFIKDSARYKYGKNGMTQIPKYLKLNSEIVFNEKVMEYVYSKEGHLIVKCESGLSIQALRLCISCPLPQALEIVSKSAGFIEPKLKQVNYAKALVGLFEIKLESGHYNIPPFQDGVSSSIFSISDQTSKKNNTEPSFVVIMTPDWSEENFDLAEPEILIKIHKEFQAYFASQNIIFTFTKSDLKKWKFSHPTNSYDKKYELIENHKNVYLFGDSFGGSSIRGAIRSATELAKKLT